MNTAHSTLARTGGSLRRAISHIACRLTRKASISIGVTVSAPPFLRLALDYKADIGKAANDNKRRRKPRQSA